MIQVLQHHERLTVATDLGDCLFRTDSITADEHDLIEYMLLNDFKTARHDDLVASLVRLDGTFAAIHLQKGRLASRLVYISIY